MVVPAAAPVAPGPMGIPMGAPAAATPPAPAEKTYNQTFEKASWDSAFVWLEKVTGQRLITTVKPISTISLKVENKTVPEIIDLFNEALFQEKFILIRGEQSFTIFSADEKIPKYKFKKILVTELPKYGRTEFVTVMIPLRSLIASDIVPQVKKMLSNFGDIYALGSSNVVIEDTVANIRVIAANLKELEEGGGSSGDLYTHPCKYVRATAVAEQLGKALKDSTTNVDTTAVANPGAMMNPQGGFQPGFDPRMMGGGDRGGRGGQQMPAGPDPRFRSVQITVIESTNTVIVTGPADKISAAEKLTKTIDVGTVERAVGGEAFPITYNVPSAQVDALANILKTHFKNTSVTITPLTTNSQILVFGFKADHTEVAGILRNSNETKSNNKVELITLSILDPVKTAETLTKSLQSTGLFVEAQATGVLLRGTEDQITAAKDFIKAMGENPTVGGMGGLSGPNMRIINIDKASPAMAADGLAELLRKLGTKNPIEVINPQAPKPTEKKPDTKPMVVPTPGAPADKKSSMMPNGYGIQRAQFISQEVPGQPPMPPATGAKPLTITVVGDKLILVSEDQEALEKASQLLRLFLNAKGEEIYEVLRLKHISAEEAAKTISEVFNGPSAAGAGRGQGGRQGGGGGFNPLQLLGQFAGIGATAPANPSKDRIQVVAERTSNSLIVVKASPLDLYTIRKLLEKAIDYDGPPEGGVAKTYTIALQYARAGDVASQIETIFRNLINPNRGGGGAGGFPGFPFPGAQQQQPQTAPTLTVTSDETSNRVIVYCNEGTYAEIDRLCKELDVATKGSLDVVRVVPVVGISPSQLSEAIDALVGRTTSTNTGSRNTGNTGGGGFNPGGFGGGFNPGGFGGGFNPGGFGGGNRGGNTGGGRGGQQGGGRGMGGRPGGNRSDPSPPGGGASNPFDYPGMDAPRGYLYDPETDGEPISRNPGPTVENSIAQAAWQQPMPMPMQPPVVGGTGPNALAQQPVPSGDISVTPLDGLSTLIVRGRTAQDVENILNFIKILEGSVKDAQIELTYYNLKSADATELVNLLTQIYSRLQISPGSSAIIPAQTNRGGQGGGFPFGGFGFGIGGGGQQQQQQSQTAGSLLLFPLPRLNQVLIAAPKAQMAAILKNIENLDKPNSELMAPRPYLLKRSGAVTVAQQLNSFFASRFTGETAQNNAIRIFASPSNNAVLVQAGEADQREIEALIRALDTGESAAVNSIELIKLRNGAADEIAAVLQQVLSVSVINPSTAANAGSTSGTQVQGGFGAVNVGGGQGQQGQFGQQQQRPGQTTGATGQNSSTSGLTTKTTTLRFMSSKDGKVIPIESGFLEDSHVIADVRINSLLVTAPPKTMLLIKSLIAELDTVSAAKSFVNVFQLKKSDATNTANLIRTLFASSTTGTGAQQAGGFPGFGGQQGGQTTGSTNVSRPLLTLTGNPADGASLIDLRLSPDTRTNTLIVAGSRNDLDTINAIIARLEDTDVPDLRPQVFKIRNGAAADIAQAISTFINNQATTVNAQFTTTSTFQTLQRNTVIVAEPVTNQLLVTAAPQLMGEIAQLISQLDQQPLQVLVQVQIVEVQLNNRDELGVELGLQSPVLFARSATGTSPGTPGFNFNTTSALANTNTSEQKSIGYQGLGNLGVGRAGANGVGGFVFSAASDTVSVLIRALKTQGRVDILSRPQLLLTDNQQGFFQVGQKYPLIQGTTLAGNGVSQQAITYEDIGIVLRVTPRIDPNGRVLMRVEPQNSGANPTPVNLGGGLVGTAIDVQTLQTTVSANDGETIILGGLIRKLDNKQENKIPVLGDLPWVGAAFRYRTQDIQRRELIFIMTPHIIRSEADMFKLVGEEARKMSWGFRDVMNIHGHGEAALSGQGVQPGNWNMMMGSPYYSPNQLPTMVDPNTTYMVPNGVPPGTVMQSPPTGQPTVMPNNLPTGAIPNGVPMNPVPPPSGPIMFNLQRPPISTPSNGFPLVKRNGEPTLYNAPGTTPGVQPAVATTPPVAPTQEGKPWDVFGK
jgi:type II secretory pathway component GspD/PulD (secretin)